MYLPTLPRELQFSETAEILQAELEDPVPIPELDEVTDDAEPPEPPRSRPAWALSFFNLSKYSKCGAVPSEAAELVLLQSMALRLEVESARTR